MSAAAAAAEAVAILKSQQSNINGTYVLRYVCLAGLVVLVRDCVVSFQRERQLIWSAPSSPSKWIYLINRYLSPVCFLTFFIPLSGFSGLNLDNDRCYGIITGVILAFLVSTGFVNYLITMRVVSLWDRSTKVLWIMGVAFVIAYATTFTAGVIALVQLRPAVQYVGFLKMCVVLEGKSPFLIAASASPLAFEFVAAGSAYWNAVDRPRQANMPLQHELAKDGFKFFLVTVIARMVNLGLVASGIAYLAVISILLSWVLLVVLLSRRVLAHEYADLLSNTRYTQKAGPSRVAGLFGTRHHSGTDSTSGKAPWAAGESVQLGEVEVEFSER